jgi:O-antigen/teichoic acid export membrane protein
MKKEKEIKKYILNLLLTTVFGGVIGFINYLFNIFLARFTTENIFGLYSAAIGVIYLIQIPTLSIQNAITKYVGETKKGNIKRFKIASLFTFGLIGIGLASTFFFLMPAFSENLNLSNELILPLSITLLFALLSPISKGILLGKEKIVLVNVILLIETLLKFGIGFIGIRMGGDINLLILANAIPAFLGCIVVLPFLKSPKSYKKKIDISYWELILMTGSLLLLSAPYTLDLILIPQSLKAEYGALSLIGKLVYFASITVASVMFARLSNEKKKKEDLKTLRITIFITFLIGVVASIFIFLFKDLIINLAFDGKYANVSMYFIIFGLIMSAYAIVYMLANFFFARDSYWYITILLFISIIQVVLLKFYVTDLFSIVRNQVIVYSVLLVLTIIYFVFNFIINRNGKEIQKGS